MHQGTPPPADTDKRQGQERLQMGAQRYLAVAGCIFVEIDRQQRVTLINQRGCALLGYPEEEIIGKNWFAHFIPPEQREEVEALHRRLIKGGANAVEWAENNAVEWAENEVLTAGGERRYIIWHNAVLRDDRGRIVGTLSSGQDVTEQRRLALRERWLGKILEDSKNEIYVFSAEDLRFLQVNRGARENLGYTMEALREMTPLDLKPEFNPTTFEQLIRPLRTGEKAHLLFTTVHRRRDGSRYPVEVSLQLSRDAPSPVFVAIVLDITERDRSIEALRESEARARAILDTTVDAIITIDERGTIASFNKAAEKIFGYTAEEAAGQNVKILMPSPYREAHDGYLHAYYTTGKRKIIGIGREVVGQRKDGTVFPIDLSVSEVPLGDRCIFTGIIRDLSERKRLEREVLEVSAQEQQRIGQELHDGLGSHLTGVAMSCRALARRLEKGRPVQKEEIEEIAALVQEGAQQARLLARGLNPVRVSGQGLQTALQELAANMQGLSGVPCLFQSEGEMPPQDAETTLHLYRIAQEALNNALKHARAEHIWIRLAYKPHAIVLSVRDDGVGLPETLEETGGIGHRVMQHRAHMIGATLHLRSAPGGGALLSCTLPLDETNHPAAVVVR